MSLRGKIFTKAIGKIMCYNPEKNTHIIKSTQDSAKLFKGYKLPKQYIEEIVDVDGMPTSIFHKSGYEGDKVIYFLHGGAYIGKVTGMYRKYARYLMDKVSAKIYMPDYRVAPEDKYPSQLEDAIKGWEYLLSQGIKEENIIVMGDSAGGNLSLVLMLKLRDEGRKLPHAAVLLSPWADMLASGDSYVFNYPNDEMFGVKGKTFEEEKRASLLASEIFSWVGDHDRKDPYLSPVFGDYHGFPPCLFVTAKNEMLLSDTLTIVDKLKKEGNEPETLIKHHMFHVYPVLIEACPEAKEANKVVVEYINRKFKE